MCPEHGRKTCDDEDENSSSTNECFLGNIFTPDSNCSVLSSKASIQFQESRGRYLVAKEDIKTGDIVAFEDPIVAFPTNHDWKVIC